MNFYFKNPELPTQYNIRQKLVALNWQENAVSCDFGDENLAFAKEACESLEYKHKLAVLLETETLMPLSYRIHDQNWREIVQYLEGQGEEKTWILKPSLLNNGQSIRILDTVKAIKTHFASTRRLGGEHVLQAYLAPDLLRDNRKYSIRMFLVLTNFAGALLYPEGYFNVSMHPYKEGDFTDLRSHLTNEHLSGEEENVLQIPTERFPWFSACYPDLKAMASRLIRLLKTRHPKAFMLTGKPAIALFGLDFMLDAHKRLWLLEANHGPCFPVRADHPLQPFLYQAFWDNLVTRLILPMAGVNLAKIDFLPFETL